MNLKKILLCSVAFIGFSYGIKAESVISREIEKDELIDNDFTFGVVYNNLNDEKQYPSTQLLAIQIIEDFAKMNSKTLYSLLSDNSDYQKIKRLIEEQINTYIEKGHLLTYLKLRSSKKEALTLKYQLSFCRDVLQSMKIECCQQPISEHYPYLKSIIIKTMQEPFLTISLTPVIEVWGEERLTLRYLTT